MLEERNERGGDGDHLTRRDVHVVDLGHCNLGGSTEVAVEVLGTGNDVRSRLDLARDGIDGDELTRVLIETLGRLGDNVALFLVGGHVVDLIGDLAVDNATVRDLDEAELVDAREDGQRADKADVGAFGGLDGAHTRVVRVVNVAGLGGDVRTTAGAGLVASNAARAQGRQTTLVREACKGVVLVHELGQLAGTEELLDGGHDGADVDQRLGRDLVDLLGGHTLAHNALHAGQAHAELVADKLADGTHAAVAEVVAFVDDVALKTVVEVDEVTKGGDDVLRRQNVDVGVDVEAELLVELVATHRGEVVTLLVEEEAVEQGLGRVKRRRLAGALLLVELHKSVLAGGGGVARKGALHHGAIAEQLDDLLVGLSDAQGAEEHRSGLLALAVDAHDDGAALVSLELEPSTARGDELHAIDQLVGVDLAEVVHTGRADELRNHNTLRAVDDERAAIGHEREIAHEHDLLLHLTGLTVRKANLGQQRGLIADVLGLALLNGVLGVAELMGAKRDLKGLRGVLNGRDILECLVESSGHKPVERFLLHGDQVGELHDRRDASEADPLTVRTRGIGCDFEISHSAMPPSSREMACYAQPFIVKQNFLYAKPQNSRTPRPLICGIGRAYKRATRTISGSPPPLQTKKAEPGNPDPALCARNK